MVNAIYSLQIPYKFPERVTKSIMTPMRMRNGEGKSETIGKQ